MALSYDWLEAATELPSGHRLGCDERQGCLFARPMPAADLLGWMLDRTRGHDIDFAPWVIDA